MKKLIYRYDISKLHIKTYISILAIIVTLGVLIKCGGPDAGSYKAEHKGNHAKGLVKRTIPKDKYIPFRGKKAVTIPNVFDLRGKVSAIRDQGNCGSCHMFAATALHRDGHLLNTGIDVALSEQDMDCTGMGCNGGDFTDLDTLVKGNPNLGGQHSLKDVPYQARDMSCKKSIPVVAHITDWHMIGDQNKGPTQKEIQEVMVQTGKPVAIYIAAGAGNWENYSGGVYNGCTFAGTDHEINIVGWDNEGEQFDASGNLPAGKGIWYLRNSWGTSWGENGFMRTKMTDSRGRKCNNVAEEAAYAVFDDEMAPVDVVFVMKTKQFTQTVTIDKTAPFKQADVEKVLAPFLEGYNK